MKHAKLRAICTVLLLIFVLSCVPADAVILPRTEVIDTTPPSLEHNPIEYAPYSYPLSLWVRVENVGTIEYVRIYFRQRGTEEWTVQDMTVAGQQDYSTQLSEEVMSAECIEYYLEASDGNQVSQCGSARSPFAIWIDRDIFIASVSPDYVSVEDAGSVSAVISGEGFSEDMTVLIGGQEVVYQYESDHKISVILPPLPVGKADLQILCQDAHAIRLNAFTYQDPQACVLVDPEEKVYIGQTIRIPVSILAGTEVTDIDFSAHLDPMLFEKTEFILSGSNADAVASCLVSSDGTARIHLHAENAFSHTEPIGYIQAKVRFVEKPVKTTVAVSAAAFGGVMVGTSSAQIQISNAIEIALVDMPQPIYAISGMQPEFLDMQLQVDYEGTQQTIPLTPGMVFLSDDTPGQGKITYFHKEVSFTYEILEKDQVQVGIQTRPDKLHYIAGEMLDTTGMDVILSRTDGTILCPVRNYSVTGFDPNILGTQQVVVHYGEFEDTFTVSVFSPGDVNCDGRITITDMMAVKSHLLNIQTLEEVQALAADVNGDGRITITDFMQIKRQLLGIDDNKG